MKRLPIAKATLVLAALAVTGAGVVSLTGHAARGDGSAAAVAPDAGVPGHATMRAYLDPETGALTTGVARVAHEELDPDTQNALRRDSAGLVEVRHANGAVSVDLQGRFQSVSVARIDAAGNVVVCTDDDEAARRTLSGATTPEVK